MNDIQHEVMPPSEPEKIIGEISAIMLSELLLLKAKQENINDMTPMKILKMAYLCQGWSLGIYGKKIFTEPVEAWQYGPVIRSIYDHYKHYVNKVVPFDNARSWNCEDFISDTVDFVFHYYRNYSAYELSQITHLKDSPWSKTYSRLMKGTIIRSEMLEAFYSERFAKSELF